MKYIKKKNIKGQDYYYFEYFLGHGTYTKYLGKVIPEDIKERMEDYFVEIALLSAKRNKVKYFFKEDVLKIEEARFHYILINHELFEKEKKLFKTLFYILFVLNSNRSEGSEVTREDIENVILKKIKPKTTIDKEVLNSIKAINFALSDGMNWNAKSIKKIHHLLFWDLYPDIAGRYKNVNNIVGNTSTTHWKEVSKEMKKLLVWFHKNKKTMYSAQLSLEFHWRFEAIHPFQDGNGRVGRILLNAFLVQEGYAPVIYFTENHQSYCNALNKARAGQSRSLAKHYIESIKKTNNAIAKYKKEGIIIGGSPKIGKWEIQRGKIRIS
jgi:Fic family protein